MKATGITRKIDELGRIVLPIELRRGLEISEKDALEIYVEDDCIILKKFRKSCLFCGNEENIVDFKGKNICSECIAQLKK
ncbi:MAG: AbrB/MazE/SpoVT family DNA-binding domain-containing protein [Oscillospiraceae bacterium]